MRSVGNTAFNRKWEHQVPPYVLRPSEFRDSQFAESVAHKIVPGTSVLDRPTDAMLGACVVAVVLVTVLSAHTISDENMSTRNS